MSSSASKIKIAPLEELFGSTEATEAIEIELEALHEYHNHPFYVKDEDMSELAESIKQRGVLIPGIVRPRIEGGYELIAGHRRKRGSELAGKKTMPVIVQALNNEEADLIMVDTNIHREKILPSEKAFAYKIKAEALARQRNAGKSTEIIGETEKTSGKTVQRYIRLTYLIPEILEDVDREKLVFMAAVYLSYLPIQIQHEIYQVPRYYSISVENAEIVKNFYKYSEVMDGELFKAILDGELLKNEEYYFEGIIELFDKSLGNRFAADMHFDTQADMKDFLQNGTDVSRSGMDIREKGVLFDGHKFIGWEKILNATYPKVMELKGRSKEVKTVERGQTQVAPVPEQIQADPLPEQILVMPEPEPENTMAAAEPVDIPAERLSGTEMCIDVGKEMDCTDAALSKETPKCVNVQPNFPTLKNDEQRKGFLSNFHAWKIWFQVPEANEICYRYDLPDGSAIAVREYNAYIKWMEKDKDENPEKMHKKLYLLHSDYHYLNDCETNMTVLVEHLRAVQRNIG